MDDGNPCTDDVCVDDLPVHEPAGAGSACSVGGTRCDGLGACVACLAATDCGGGVGPCLVPACTQGKCGTAPAPAATSCDDGDACTQTDTCVAGSCVGGDPVSCSGGLVCIAGACVPPCTAALGPPGMAPLISSSAPGSTMAVDLNGDGEPDLVVTSNSVVSVLLGSGNGMFAARVEYTAGPGPYFVAVADLDGDGRPELVIASGAASAVGVLKNQGDGTFAAAISYPTSATSEAITALDLNGDGKPDLVVSGTDALSVLLNQGDGTFAAAASYPTGPNPYLVAAADLDGDGKPDLATTSYTSDTVTVLLNHGDGTFAAAASYPTGTTTTSVQQTRVPSVAPPLDAWNGPASANEPVTPVVLDIFTIGFVLPSWAE